jgi:putative NADH-flavin reductase
LPVKEDKMKIAVFGSTGKTGREVVRQALDRGYTVTAYVRNPQKLDMTHPNLNVVSGELNDRGAIKTAVQGADCVISALGPYFTVRDTALSNGVENILLVMKDCGVNKIIQLSTISSPDPNDGKDFRAKMLVGMVKRSYPGSYAEIVRIGQMVRDSNMDWTLVRITLLNDKPLSKKLRVGYLGQKIVRTNISRADVAWFMLEQAENAEHSRKAPAISN